MKQPGVACCECHRVVARPPDYDAPESLRTWCSQECMDAWDAAHPEEGWVSVDKLTLLERAELEAILGLGRRA